MHNTNKKMCTSLVLLPSKIFFDILFTPLGGQGRLFQLWSFHASEVAYLCSLVSKSTIFLLHYVSFLFVYCALVLSCISFHHIAVWWSLVINQGLATQLRRECLLNGESSVTPCSTRRSNSYMVARVEIKGLSNHGLTRCNHQKALRPLIFHGRCKLTLITNGVF